MQREKFGEILFDERSIADPPDGKWRYRRTGLFYCLPLILLIWFWTMIIFDSEFNNNAKMVCPLALLLIISGMMFYSVFGLLIGYEHLVVYEAGIRIPERSLKNIIFRTHNTVPYENMKEIRKLFHPPIPECPAFDIQGKNGGYWHIRKCFVKDIDRLSEILNQICLSHGIKFVDFDERMNKLSDA